MQTMNLTPAQKAQLVTAIVVFIVAIANVFGINIPIVPTV